MIHEREKAVLLSDEGIPQSEIAEKLGRSIIWVQKWVRRAREGQTLNDLPRSGRPREIKDSTRSQITSGLEEKSVGSLRRTERKLQQVKEVKELCRGNRWTFVHDGAHAHRAKKDQGMAWRAKKLRVSAGQQIVPTSTSSKPFGEWLSKRFSVVNPSLMTKFGKEREKLGTKIPLEVVQRQITGWGRRLSAVIGSQEDTPNIKRWWMV